MTCIPNDSTPSVARARLNEPKTTASMSSMGVIVKSGMLPPVVRGGASLGRLVAASEINSTNVRALQASELQCCGMATKAASTRSAILGRAVDIASVEGLEGLTIGRLASELQLSKSGLFAHFG